MESSLTLLFLTFHNSLHQQICQLCLQISSRLWLLVTMFTSPTSPYHQEISPGLWLHSQFLFIPQIYSEHINQNDVFKNWYRLCYSSAANPWFWPYLYYFSQTRLLAITWTLQALSCFRVCAHVLSSILFLRYQCKRLPYVLQKHHYLSESFSDKSI